MSTRVISGGDLTPEQRRVHRVEHILRRDGGSPGNALDGLASIVEDETWRKVPRGVDDPRPFASFTAFVEGKPFGLGYSVKQLRTLLRLQHPAEGNADVRTRMEAMRAEVERLIDEDIPAASEHRGNTVAESNNRVRATNSVIAHSDQAGYIVSRLKRDDPGLAERVVNGEITANAAALAKGWRKPRVVLTSPESVARSLRKHLNSDDLAALVRLLTNDS